MGKNLLEVGGEPLLVRAIRMAGEIKPGDVQVHVSTDSQEMADLAEMFGAKVYRREGWLAADGSTVDEVVTDFLREYWNLDDPLLVFQPTVVAEEKVMVQALKDLWDWGLMHKPTALAIKPHGLVWGGHPSAPPERVNSQSMDDRHGQEIGIRYYPPGSKSGVIEEVKFTVDTFIDIDTPEDLVSARALVQKSKTILFRVRYGGLVGSGHLYRALAIAKELQHHHILFDFTDEQPAEFPFLVVERGSEYATPSLIINDALDTSEEKMLDMRFTAPVITFEDQGPGARYADAVVNALYANGATAYTGSDYAILRPEFQDSGFSRKGILVTFGGTDSLDLTTRVAGILGNRAEYVKPPYSSTPNLVSTITNPSMGALMNNSSVIITSAGRTVFEAAACGTPAIVLAQNAREATHSHLGIEHGNLYLGLANFVTNDQILHAVNAFTADYALQDEMAARAKESIDGKGLQRVISLVNEVIA